MLKVSTLQVHPDLLKKYIIIDLYIINHFFNYLVQYFLEYKCENNSVVV